MSSTRLPRRATAVALATVVAAGLAVTGTAASAAPAGTHLPNLVVSSASVDGSTVTEGATLTVTHTVRNAGSAGAAKSHTRFYLTRDAKASRRDREHSGTNPRTSPTDILLSGTGAIAPLRPRATSKHVPTKVTVPVGTAAGKYMVLACADDAGAVRESAEGDNCRVADPVQVKPAPGSADLQLGEFADSFTWSDPSSGLTYLRFFCSGTVPANKLSPSAAVASAEKFLTAKAGKTALSKVAHAADTPVAAQQLAAAALASGSPGLALAAELRAHDLEPRIATHLVNAAAIAETVGRPNEALGLLDGAAALDARRPAMGVSLQAIADVVRGNALVLTGRPAAAEGLFSAARQAEPLLKEADAGLANVEGCKSPSAKARAYVTSARVRTDDRKDAVIDPVHPPRPPKPRLDLSHGKSSEMRILPAAPNPVRGTVQNAVYRGIENDFQGEIQHQIDEENSLAAKLNTANQHITRAEQRRRDGIMTLAYAFDTTNPLVVADAKTVNHLIDELTNRLEGFWGGGTGEVKSKYEQLSDDAFAACEGPGHPANCYDTTLRSTCVPALEDAHGTWWTLMGELESAANTWVEDTSRGMSAYAANLADPSANRRVLLAIEELERAEFALVVQQADFWTHYEVIFSDHCVDTGDPGDPGDAPAPGSAADPGKCPPLLRASTAASTSRAASSRSTARRSRSRPRRRSRRC